MYFILLFLTGTLGLIHADVADEQKPAPPEITAATATPKPHWTRLYCVGADMRMSPASMGQLFCRDKMGRNYSVMGGGIAFGPSGGFVRGGVLWTYGTGDIEGLYSGGNVGLSFMVGGQAGYYVRSKDESFRHIVLVAGTFTLPPQDMALICAMPLTSATASILTNVSGEVGGLMIMSDHKKH